MRKNRLLIHPLVHYSIAVFSLLLGDECLAQATANSTQNATNAVTPKAPFDYGPYYLITNDGIDFNYASDSPTEPYWYPTSQGDYVQDYYPAIAANPVDGEYLDDVVDWPSASTASYDDNMLTNSDGTGCSNPYYFQSSCSCSSCYSCYCPNEDAVAVPSTAVQTPANDNGAESSAASVGQQTAAASAGALIYDDAGFSEAIIALAIFAAVLMLCLVVAMAVFIFVAVNGKIEVGEYRFQLRGSRPPNMHTGIILVEGAAGNVGHQHHQHHHHHRSPEEATAANQAAAVSQA